MQNKSLQVLEETLGSSLRNMAPAASNKRPASAMKEVRPRRVYALVALAASVVSKSSNHTQDTDLENAPAPEPTVDTDDKMMTAKDDAASGTLKEVPLRECF